MKNFLKGLPVFVGAMLLGVGIITLAQNGGGVNGGGGGGGSVSSVSAGTGLTASPNPITGVGTISLLVPVTVPNGGIGATTLTNHGILVGAGTSAVSGLTALTNDQLILGSTGVNPGAVSLVNCGSATQALSYSTSTHTFGCQTISAGGGGATTVMKTATTTRTSTTTVALDPDLQFTSVTAGNHTLHCNITVGVGATGATPGFKLAVQVNSPGTTPQFLVTGISNGSPVAFNQNADGVLTAAFSPGSGISVYNIDVGWIASSGAGTAGLLWAQQTSSATATSINVNSFCQLT